MTDTPQLNDLPLGALQPHPDNSNVMPEALLLKLVGHIRQSGRYPAVIVRPHGHKYQILDGHHRVAALRRLQHQRVRCEVWDVDDQQAMLLLATLNRLQGDDDAQKRGHLLANLRARFDEHELLKRLPDDAPRLRRLIELDQPAPAPRPPQPIETMPVAVHFFVLPEQRRRIEAALRRQGGSREAALLIIIERFESSNPREDA